MIWKETSAAADNASSLSELLEHEGLYEKGALRWLGSEHVDKFLKAINTEESAKLRNFAERWCYKEPEWSNKFAKVDMIPDYRLDNTSKWITYFISTTKGDTVKTNGFPLLDSLWVISPHGYYQNRQNLKTTDAAGDGRKLVARLAEFDPDWIGHWWLWRRENREGRECGPGSLGGAVIETLSENDFREHTSRFSNEIVATIIREIPVFLKLLPNERRGPVLRLILNDDSCWHRQVIKWLTGWNREVIQVLSEQGVPSDAIAIIDNVLDFAEKSSVIDWLNELVESWQGPSGSDPVTEAITREHKRIDRLLRARWDVSNLSPGSVGKPDLWTAKYNLQRQVGPALAKAARAIPNNFRLELGFNLGLDIAEEEAEPSPAKVAELLNKIGIGTSDGMVDVLLPMVELWTSLRTLAKYEANSWGHKTELVGLRAKVASLAATAPVLWAQSLPWILARSSDLGDVAQAVTLELALTSQEVSAALESACNEHVEQIRLKARGLRALLQGLEDPGSGLAGTLSDAAARHMDGTPVFPHPLTPVSATWLGSAGVERAIINGVRRASERFAAEVRDQGGDIEEALTKALAKEIEVEFREIQPRLKLFNSSFWSPAPVLSVRQRPLSKSLEEPVYGCDLALLLNGTVHKRYKATWADLIQVKKSSALQHYRHKGHRIDSWKIGSKQLGEILKWSATAAYWLIASAGEVFVIPAKHLLAVRQGRPRSASSQSFTVGYHEVRSAAIPLEQYLTDLLIGQWVGTTSDDVLRIAKGDSPYIRPRVVIEVTISVGQENRDL